MQTPSFLQIGLPKMIGDFDSQHDFALFQTQNRHKSIRKNKTDQVHDIQLPTESRLFYVFQVFCSFFQFLPLKIDFTGISQHSSVHPPIWRGRLPVRRGGVQSNTIHPIANDGFWVPQSKTYSPFQLVFPLFWRGPVDNCVPLEISNLTIIFILKLQIFL
jgi:hypothetical protein